MHYYKFNIADWSLGTSHLTLEEESIYFRLINHYYDTESPIPLETQSVFRKLRFGSCSDIALSILDEFFKKTDKGFVHLRCEEMLKEYRKTVSKNKKNGAKGGRPKKDAALEESQGEPSGFPVESQTEPKDNPNQEPLTINQEPLLKDKAKAKRFVPPTQEEAGLYFLERGHHSASQEAEKFIDFYESKGWLVGKAKMKDWKAAIRNWMKNNFGGGNAKSSGRDRTSTYNIADTDW